jgi:hypothetical protein
MFQRRSQVFISALRRRVQESQTGCAQITMTAKFRRRALKVSSKYLLEDHRSRAG